MENSLGNLDLNFYYSFQLKTLSFFKPVSLIPTQYPSYHSILHRGLSSNIRDFTLSDWVRLWRMIFLGNSGLMHLLFTHCFPGLPQCIYAIICWFVQRMKAVFPNWPYRICIIMVFNFFRRLSSTENEATLTFVLLPETPGLPRT